MVGYPSELSAYLWKLDKDKQYKISEYKALRGKQANKYFHKLINELARYNRGIGHAISDDEMKIEINLSYGTIATDNNGKVSGCKVPKGVDIKHFYKYAKWYKEEDGCDCYVFYKRTHELNTKEFAHLIMGLEKECQQLGIETLSEREFKKMMEEYDKCFKKETKQ